MFLSHDPKYFEHVEIKDDDARSGAGSQWRLIT